MRHFNFGKNDFDRVKFFEKNDYLKYRKCSAKFCRSWSLNFEDIQFPIILVDFLLYITYFFKVTVSFNYVDNF